MLLIISTKKNRFWCSHAKGASLGKTNADEVLSSKAKKKERKRNHLHNFISCQFLWELNFSKDRVSVASARACKLLANISWQLSKLVSWPIYLVKNSEKVEMHQKDLNASLRNEEFWSFFFSSSWTTCACLAALAAPVPTSGSTSPRRGHNCAVGCQLPGSEEVQKGFTSLFSLKPKANLLSSQLKYAIFVYITTPTANPIQWSNSFWICFPNQWASSASDMKNPFFTNLGKCSKNAESTDLVSWSLLAET